MVDKFGSGVSRVLDPKQAQFTQVIWQQGKPPLDSELNLAQQLENDWRQQLVMAGTPSGWLSNDVNASKDFVTNPAWSNWFQFGRQKSGEKKSIAWAVVNGWLVPVTGTKTGTPPGAPDNVNTWNKVTLDPPPSSSADSRADFVFLEVWQARVSPSLTTNKPSSSAIYRFGNVEGGYSYLSDDTQDPQIGFETTQRVQIQYRIRVVKGLIGLSTYPDGFDPTTVKARGAATAETTYTFANMRQELGDAGLWRAGDGTENSLGTVDGYVYAIPLCVAFRRNSVVWAPDPSSNLNGGFNRNPTAIDRTGIKTFVTPVLAVALSDVALTLTLDTGASIPLPANPASAVLIQIGDELMTYSTLAVSGTVVGGISRGVQGTKAEAHPIGSVVKVLSGRPDGLFSDQIAGLDILDLRHAVSPTGFDHDTLLRSNLDKMLKGELRANWKRSGGATQGVFVAYQDRVSSSAAGLSVTKIDSPDNIRMIFSDAAVQQKVEVICTPYTSNVVFPAEQSIGSIWSLSLNATTTTQGSANIFNAGDQIKVTVAQFQNTVGVDGDQVRILNEVSAEGITGVSTGNTTFSDAVITAALVQSGDTLVIFTGAAQGSYQVVTVSEGSCVVDRAIPAVAGITYVVRKGRGSVEVRFDGDNAPLPQHRFTVTPSNPTPTQDILVEFVGVGAPFPTASTRKVYITTHIQYGGGRGLARRPDSLHNILLVNPSVSLMAQQSGVTGSTHPSLRTSWALLWSKYRSGLYKGQLPVTTESYADLGSKTVVLSPFRNVEFPSTVTVDGSSVNPYTSAFRTSATGSSANSTTFTDLSVDFTAVTAVVAGDVLVIASGLAAGTYQVVTVGVTTLTVDRAVPTATVVSYTIHHAQGLMPIKKLDGTTSKWTTSDPLGLFSGSTQPELPLKNLHVTLPRHLVPGWGAVHVPILPANGATFDTGVNFMLQSRKGSSLVASEHNPQYINYTSGVISHASLSTGDFSGVSTVPAVFNGATFTFSGYTFAGARFFTDNRGLGRKGLELPPFYGIARLFAVYEASDRKANGSDFSATTRTVLGSGAKNLLKQGFTGPTFWVENDDDGDSTFIINADALDLTKAPSPISTFESAHYVIEASIFGFDRGSFSLDKPFRLVLSRNRTTATDAGTRANNIGVSIVGPSTIIPAPMTASDTALVNYSRTPYQGDPWGSMSSYVDSVYAAGPLSSSTAFQVDSSNLNLSALTRPNQKSLEVLSSVGFVTTLGTGRLSGDVVRSNIFDFRNVGFEDPASYPPTSGVAARPAILTGALSYEPTPSPTDDKEIGQEYLGCVERLPLGALWRSKDFRGGRFSNVNSSPFIYLDSVGVGLGVASLANTKVNDHDEAGVSTASLTPGLPGDVLVHVDGETGNYALLTNFRTARGGSVFVASGDHPGGELSATYADVMGTGRGTRIVSGRAFLVRNTLTTVGAAEASAGDELMMLVVTTASEVGTVQPGAVLIGTNGTSEGDSAADLYRIEGRPLISNHVHYDVDPSTITLTNRI